MSLSGTYPIRALLVSCVVALLALIFFSQGDTHSAYQDYPNYDATFEFTLCNKMQGHNNGSLNGIRTGTAESGTDNTLTDTDIQYGAASFAPADYLIGFTITIDEGTGEGQTRTIIDNTTDTVTVDSDWDTNPDGTSKYSTDCTDDLNTSSSADLTTNFVIPSGSTNFIHLIQTVPEDFCIAPDHAGTPQYDTCSLPSIPNGEKVGGITNDAMLGLVNGPCNSLVPVPFVFWDSTTQAGFLHADPGNNTVYDVGEGIYEDVDMTREVSAGDERLVHATLAPGTVGGGDADVGTAIRGFKTPEKHSDDVTADGLYEVGEGVYNDVDLDDKVSVGDVRLVVPAAHPTLLTGPVIVTDGDVGTDIVPFLSIAHPRPEGQSDRNRPLANDNNTGILDTLGDGINGNADSESNDIFVHKNPTYFLDLFDPDKNFGGTDGPKPPIQAHARYSGQRIVSSEWIFLSFIVFRPGQLVDPDDNPATDDGFTAPHPFSRFTKDKGWATIIVLIPPDPTEYAGRLSTIGDFCSELVSFSMMLGTGEGGSTRVLSPDDPGTQLLLGYTAGQRDYDLDGIENGLDPCPYLEILTTWTDDADTDPQGGPHRYDPRVDDNEAPLDDDLDPDDDRIPGLDDGSGHLVPGTGCDPWPSLNNHYDPTNIEDPTPGPGGPCNDAIDNGLDGDTDQDDLDCYDSGGGDHDGDGFQNNQDNCPLIPNPVGVPGHVDNEKSEDYITVAKDGGDKSDGLGDPCDADDDTADGAFLITAQVQAKCIGGTDADGDGWCSTATGENDARPEAHGAYPSGLKKVDTVCHVPLDGNQIYDIDCDGFSEWVETHAGTNGAEKCSADTVKSNEDLDAWPPDADDNKSVDIFDVLKWKPSYGSGAGDGTGKYNARFDLDADSDVDIFDVLKIKPHYGKSCADAQ